MKPNPVGWFEIYVDDMPRAKAFYEAVFQTQLEKLETPGTELYAFPMERETSGAPGALVRMEGFSAGRNSVIIYFTCQDCAMEAARAVESGGSIHMEKFAIGSYGFISLVLDSEGNMIGLHSLN